MDIYRIDHPLGLDGDIPLGYDKKPLSDDTSENNKKIGQLPPSSKDGEAR
jgi:hypothetical protein